MSLFGVHSTWMLVAKPLALKRHYSVVAPGPVPGQFAVSPTE